MGIRDAEMWPRLLSVGEHHLGRGQAGDQELRIGRDVPPGARVQGSPSRQVVRGSFLKVSLEGKEELSREGLSGLGWWSVSGDASLPPGLASALGLSGCCCVHGVLLPAPPPSPAVMGGLSGAPSP